MIIWDNAGTWWVLDYSGSRVVAQTTSLEAAKAAKRLLSL